VRAEARPRHRFCARSAPRGRPMAARASKRQRIKQNGIKTPKIFRGARFARGAPSRVRRLVRVGSRSVGSRYAALFWGGRSLLRSMLAREREHTTCATVPGPRHRSNTTLSISRLLASSRPSAHLRTSHMIRACFCRLGHNTFFTIFEYTFDYIVYIASQRRINMRPLSTLKRAKKICECECDV
jgi:hypothetical protein